MERGPTVSVEPVGRRTKLTHARILNARQFLNNIKRTVDITLSDSPYIESCMLDSQMYVLLKAKTTQE